MKNIPLRNMVFSAIFTALIILGAKISFKVGPLPFVLANLFVLLAGLFLGPKWAVYTVLVYLLLGFSGLPVFAGGGGGLIALTGYTGGFLLGYLLAALVTGLIAKAGKYSPGGIAWALFLGVNAVWLPGIPWFMQVTRKTLGEAVLGFWPFYLGDLIKAAAIYGITISLKASVPHLIPALDALQSRDKASSHDA